MSHVHISRFAGTNAKAIADVLHVLILSVLIGRASERNTDIRLCRRVKGCVARHQNVLGLVLVPLGLDALELTVFLDVALGNGEVHGIQLVLMTRAEGRSLGTEESMLDREGYSLQLLDLTMQGADVTSVLPVARRITGEAVSRAHMILGDSTRAVNS